MNLPINPSEAFKKLNPHIYGVARLPDPERKQNQRSQSEAGKLESGEERMAFCISIISLRSRLVDEHDNLRTGAKPLVDSITESLGFDNDNHPGLIWRYGQVLSQTKGTVVVIEWL